MRLFSSSSVAALVLIAAPPVLAQTDAPEVEAVVVTGGSQVELPGAYAGGQVARGGRVGLFGALEVMDTPYAVTSYTQQLMLDQQARSVADVLQNDPVVRVAKGFGNFQELYVVRGFPVYSDDMAYNGVYGILPRQFVAAEFLERVEVFHGANTFLNGAAPGGSGVGGAFNLVPKRAPDAPLTRLTAGWETGGQLYGAADVARRFGDFGARLNLARRDGEQAIQGQQRELGVAALGLDYRGERFRFAADVGLQDHHIDAPRPSVTPAGAIPEPPSADSNFAQPWTYTDERQLFGVVRGEVDLTDTFSAWAAVGGRDGEEQNVLANPTAQASGVTSAYRFDNRREDAVVSADIGLRAQLQTGPVGHRLVVSASSVSLKSRNAYAFSNFAGFPGSLYAPTAVAPPVPNFFVGGSFDAPHVTERTENGSLAIADMLSFLDGAVLATVGLRRQEIETASFDYNSGAELSRYKSDAVTPAFALVYKPSQQLSLYANYSEALVPGQIAPATSGGVPIVNAGEVLEPFRAEQVEAGAKYDAGRFGGTLSVFNTTMPSAVVENARFTAGGEQQNRGVELSVYGEPVEGLRVIGGATWLDTEIARSATAAFQGRSAIGVPDFQASLNAEWDVPAAEGLILEGRITHTGSQWANGLNTVALDAWTRLDLGARYALQVAGQPITVRARLENVTGEDYWASAGGYPGANYLVLGAPRTLLVSASVDF
ncbi:TonB-dependent receptor [Phenylobacterium deserti]|uniref:TonB-dependent siderophore receptor n=1 Tax=Phenylobacterium deserti TaxID=1914756 RepID=A0A328ADM7_9CAUL|nr:TonB-dependent receptor [Phenylobacterium deserti]RAK52750.1 TonB-dependent siderophore receptor [Phenylobacterium deserti]